MLHKKYRLTKPQFATVYARGKKHHFQHLTIVYSPAATFAGSVVVGKKVSKRAVRRNTLRRRVYARLQAVVAQKNPTGSFIVILKPSYNSLSRPAADVFLTASIDAVLQKA